MSKKECDLCKAEKLTKQYYEDNLLWIADCKTCKVPIIVLKKHQAKFTAEEKFYITDIVMEKFGEKAPNHLDWKMKTIKDHAHCHLRGGKRYYLKNNKKEKL